MQVAAWLSWLIWAVVTVPLAAEALDFLANLRSKTNVLTSLDQSLYAPEYPIITVLKETHSSGNAPWGRGL